MAACGGQALHREGGGRLALDSGSPILGDDDGSAAMGDAGSAPNADAVSTAPYCYTEDPFCLPGQPACFVPTLPPAGRRPLSHREYNNVVRDLLGDATRPADGFLQEWYANGYDNGSADLPLDNPQQRDFVNAAAALAAAAVATQSHRLIGSCDPSQAPDPCVQAFLSTFAPRAYRRPLVAAEQQELLVAYAMGSAPTGPHGGGFSGGLEMMLGAALKAPAFLYREELGTGSDGFGLVTLTPYEVASELSFLFTGSLPDDELWSAARGGRLITPSDSLHEAERLLASAAAKSSLRAFAHQWMATDRLTAVTKDPGVYPSWSSSLAGSMSAELDQLYDQTFGSPTGSLRALLSTTDAFVDPPLAALYGIVAPAGPGMQHVMLDPRNRRGILTRAGVLTAHSDYDSSGPVTRGAFVSQNLVCRPIPSPPGNVPVGPTAAQLAVEHQTTRQGEVTVSQSQSVCTTCHSILDGIGFGFEEFDAVGAYRTTENGQPVDDSGNLSSGTSVDGPFSGAVQFEDKLVASDDLKDCYVRQVYRDTFGRTEDRGATPRLGRMRRCLGPETPLTDPFFWLVASPVFTFRRGT
jgi:hypothetical protein